MNYDQADHLQVIDCEKNGSLEPQEEECKVICRQHDDDSRKRQRRDDSEAAVTVKERRRATVFWFSTDTWQGRVIFGLGLATVLLAQHNYDWGYTAFFAVYFPAAVLISLPWLALRTTVSRLCQCVTFCYTQRIKKLQHDYMEELATEELDQEAVRQRLHRQHVAFVGLGRGTQPHKKALTGCSAWGWRGIAVLGGVCLLSFVILGKDIDQQLRVMYLWESAIVVAKKRVSQYYNL